METDNIERIIDNKSEDSNQDQIEDEKSINEEEEESEKAKEEAPQNREIIQKKEPQYKENKEEKENENEKLFKFTLELVDEQELTSEFTLNVANSKIFPNIYYINIQKNIYEYDRDIFFLNNDEKHTCIKPILTTNYNASNDNSILVEQKFIDINHQVLKQEKYTKVPKIDLFLIILDEKCNKTNDDSENNLFISFQFYGSYHNLIHYKENTTYKELFNDKKNKFVIKQDHCRTQYFINYIDINNTKSYS